MVFRRCLVSSDGVSLWSLGQKKGRGDPGTTSSLFNILVDCYAQQTEEKKRLNLCIDSGMGKGTRGRGLKADSIITIGAKIVLFL